jgi:hypothetical protein
MIPAIYHYEIQWEQNMGGGRGMRMCLKTEDHETGRLAWRTLCADKLENEVRDVQVTCNGVPFYPVPPWPRPAAPFDDTSTSTHHHRALYAARAVEAACVLAKRSTDIVVEDTLIRRATQMLAEVWQVELKLFHAQAGTGAADVEVETAAGIAVVLPEKLRLCEKAFWDAVILYLHDDIVYRFTAYYGETVNPTPEHHNVVLHVQPTGSAVNYVFDLKCP